MKIGLISINMHTKNLNFASPLHTYAFQQFLKQKGIDSTIIDYKPVYYNDFNMRHPYETYKIQYENLKSSGKKDAETKKKIRIAKKRRDAYQRLYAEREIRYDKFQRFIEKNYQKTDACYDSDQLEILDPGFDCYICVTDVIWKNEPGEGFDRGYFLASKAMENKWKISYAASRGVHYAQTANEIEKFFYYIEDIDWISVREDSLKGYIEENSGKKAELVLDPVLLLDKSFYQKMAVKPKEERYILLYYVMEHATDTIHMAVEYARAHDLLIVELTDFPYPDRLDSFEGIRKLCRYDIGIEEWLGYIAYAERIFTNSFHASCFSILFEKQFYLGYRHGDKTTNLLDEFGLASQRVSSISEIENLEENRIDYAKVGKVLRERRKASESWILGAIQNCESKKKPVKDYEWWKKSRRYKMIYHSGSKAEDVHTEAYYSQKGETKRLATGNYEFYPLEKKTNNGYYFLDECLFSRETHHFLGWNVRFRIDKKWFWFTNDGGFHQKNDNGYQKWGGSGFLASMKEYRLSQLTILR